MNSRKKNFIKSVSEFLDVMNLSDFLRCEGFHIFKFEDHFKELPKQISLHSQGYFELTLVTYSEKNATNIQVDHTHFRSAEDSLTFVAPGQSTEILVRGTKAEDVKGYMIVFTSNFLGNSTSEYNIIKRFPYFNIRFSPVHYLTDEHRNHVSELFELLYQKFQHMKTGNEELLNAYLNVLLLEIQQILELKHKMGNRAEQLVYNFENLIKKTPAKHQKLNFYASQLNVSTVYLSECLKKITGISAKSVIDEYLIMEIKSLLNYSDYSISDIAHLVGFDEVSNFIVYFKKHTDNTPHKYRNLVKG